jgi:DHA2 family multidrug resistance protein
MYDHRSTFHHAMLSEHTHAGGRATAEYLDRFQALGVPDASRYAALDRVLDVQAGTLALNDVFWGFGLIFGLAMVLIWLARPPFASSGPGGH